MILKKYFIIFSLSNFKHKKTAEFKTWLDRLYLFDFKSTLKRISAGHDMTIKIREEYSSGTQRFLMFSQWFKDGTNYGAHKDDFIRWYKTL